MRSITEDKNATERGVHYTTHDTCLTHGHRKLRLAEDFKMLLLILKRCT